MQGSGCRWFGHVERINEKMLRLELPGIPKRRLVDLVEEDMSVDGVSKEDAERWVSWR